MSAQNRMLAYLQQANIEYEMIEYEATDSLQQAALQCQVASAQVARAVLLGDEHGLLLVVLPLDHVINFSRLFALAGRELEPVDRVAARYVFTDCETGSIPSIAAPFQIHALVDNALLAQQSIYLEGGSRSVMLRVSGEDFRHLHRASAQGDFSTPAHQLQVHEHAFVNQGKFDREQGIRQLRPVEGLRYNLEQLQKLPSMHPLSKRLLQLYHDPNAGIAQLVKVIEDDPSVTAQLLRHARSAYYNYPGEIETLSQAINQVLGFDTAINTALGVSALSPFDLPMEGPLGMISLWRHALHCAALSRSMASMLPRHLDYKPDLIYLAGLLHNFGFFAYGHLFKAEYFLLNQVVAANPDVPVTLIEKRTLGLNHTQVGELLMEAWNMPEILRVTLSEHHNETYQGKHSLYPNLILLCNCLLKPYGLGDAADETPPATILNALGLSLEQAREVVEAHMERAGPLDEIASSIRQQWVA